MIDGLKLTFSGDELRLLLDERIQMNEKNAERWTRERTRRANDATDAAPVRPERVCEIEAARHAWRARVLTFIRDHIKTDETYLLDSWSLEFGGLVPEMPEALAQEEFEERHPVMGFNAERSSKAGEYSMPR
jgi:hypothetical protein